jgi:DNA repair protein SbcD/Mre11
MSVTIKREFQKAESESENLEIESLSLQEYFLEHIKDEVNDKEFVRLKLKIDELFAEHEESYDDTL